MENKKISVIIPMYNEELVIEECYKRLKENITKLKKYDYELIFINDGSLSCISFEKAISGEDLSDLAVSD